MSGSSGLGLTALMFAAGVGIPVMAALNAGLGARLESPNAAAAILFLVGLAVAAMALALTGPPARAAFAATPPQLYAGGVLVAFYVLSVTWAAPRIGVGNAVFAVLLGQLVAAAAIDHFALLGASQSPITLRRLAGLALMAAGVFLARRAG